MDCIRSCRRRDINISPGRDVLSIMLKFLHISSNISVEILEYVSSEIDLHDDDDDDDDDDVDLVELGEEKRGGHIPIDLFKEGLTPKDSFQGMEVQRQVLYSAIDQVPHLLLILFSHEYDSLSSGLG